LKHYLLENWHFDFLICFENKMWWSNHLICVNLWMHFDQLGEISIGKNAWIIARHSMSGLNPNLRIEDFVFYSFE
jgi:hypothetical protein